jgi:glycosyltransferase involved in cell wall biosynthesis
MKKNILVIASTFPRWKNDTEPDFIKELCDELSSDFKIHVLVPHYKGLKFKEKVDKLYIHRFAYIYPYKYQKLAYGGILPNIKKNPLLVFQTPFFFISELINTIKVVKNENIDLIHAHWFFPHGFIAAICNKYLNVKSLITIHAGCVTGLNSLPFIKRPISGFTVKNAKTILSVSSFGKNILRKMVSKNLTKLVDNKVEVFPMGIYTKKFKIKKNKRLLRKKYRIKEKIVFLFLGRLAEKKGVKYLINALLLLKNLDYILLIGGDGPLRKNLEMLVDKLNLRSKVRFLGHVGKEKIDYFSLADILVFPSIVAKSGDTEGVPVTIMEGMASGIPIIATDVGGVKDIVKNNINGILIEEKNSKQIAEKLICLIKNKKFKQKISKGALETSKKYDLGFIGKRIKEIYNN